MPHLIEIQETVELVHRIVGYPLAFIVGPLAIATFAGKRGHRILGWTYVVLMTYLYATGTFLTLTRHDWTTWNFARNVTFNFFGFSMVLHGLRAVYLYRRQPTWEPGRLDRFLRGLLIVTAIALFSVAIFKHTPMRVYTAICITFVVLEMREYRGGVLRKSTLYRRHIRYMLGSYFYVLTVVSLVHLRDEIPHRNTRWLWAPVLGIVIVYLMTSRRPALAQRRGRITRWAMATTVMVAIVFGSYVTYELVKTAA